MTPANTTGSSFTDKDVLFGKWKFCRENGGNKVLIELVRERLPEYDAADKKSDYQDEGTKRDRVFIKQEIISLIKERGGRFLRIVSKEGDSGGEVSDREAIEKVIATFTRLRREAMKAGGHQSSSTVPDGQTSSDDPVTTGDPTENRAEDETGSCNQTEPIEPQHMMEVGPPTATVAHQTEDDCLNFSRIFEVFHIDPKEDAPNHIIVSFGDSLSGVRLLMAMDDEKFSGTLSGFNVSFLHRYHLDDFRVWFKTVYIPARIKPTFNREVWLSYREGLDTAQPQQRKMAPTHPTVEHSAVQNADGVMEDAVANAVDYLTDATLAQDSVVENVDDSGEPVETDASVLSVALDLESVHLQPSLDENHITDVVEALGGKKRDRSARSVSSRSQSATIRPKRASDVVIDTTFWNDTEHDLDDASGMDGTSVSSSFARADMSSVGHASSSGEPEKPTDDMKVVNYDCNDEGLADAPFCQKSALKSIEEGNEFRKVNDGNVDSLGNNSTSPPTHVSLLGEPTLGILSSITSSRTHSRPVPQQPVSASTGVVGLTVAPMRGDDDGSLITTTTSVAQNSQIKYIRELLRQMKDSPGNAEVQVQCCGDISNFLWENDEWFKGGFARRKIAEEILQAVQRAMKMHFGHPKVPEYALNTIKYMQTVANHRVIKSAKRATILAAIDAMQQNVRDAQVQDNACLVLGSLAYDDNDRKLTVVGVPAIVAAMQRFREHVRIQEHGCLALGRLAASCKFRRSVIKSIGVLVGAMEKHADRSVIQAHACCALSNLGEESDARESIAAVKGITLVVSAMQQHQANASVQCESCSLLSALAHHSATYGKEIACEDGIQAIVNAMLHHSDDTRLLAGACQALANLAWYNSKNCELIARVDGIRFVLAAMQQHSDHAEIQEHGCLSLVNLAKTSPSNVATIIYAGGIPSVVIGMQENLINPQVQANGCMALVHLTRDDEGTRRLVGRADGVNAIVAAMKRHPSSGQVQGNACSALARATKHPSSNMEPLAAAGGASTVLEAMKTHATNIEVQENGSIVVCRLATEISSCRDEILRSGGVKVLKRAVTSSFPSNSMLRTVYAPRALRALLGEHGANEGPLAELSPS